MPEICYSKTEMGIKMEIFRYHRYNKDRGAEVDTEVFKQIVRDEGYIIQDAEGINFNVFSTNCPHDKCQRILRKLMKSKRLETLITEDKPKTRNQLIAIAVGNLYNDICNSDEVKDWYKTDLILLRRIALENNVMIIRSKCEGEAQ